MKMENRKARFISAIEKLLISEKLTKQQCETLTAFDCFNELEAHASLSARHTYLETLGDLGAKVPEPFEVCNCLLQTVTRWNYVIVIILSESLMR
jgi:hypothetical protein